MRISDRAPMMAIAVASFALVISAATAIDHVAADDSSDSSTSAARAL